MTEDVKEILLNSSNSKMSVNGDISLNIDLSSDEKKFPSNGVNSNINQYKQYIKEKDASNKYRFVFTINSVCSNVLYNHISEIVEKTSNGVKFYGSDKVLIKKNHNKYVQYKYNEDKDDLRRDDLIKDTGYSHPECGNFIYNPGVDIFNNHRFRGREFVIVADKGVANDCENYNTIFDTLREYDGSNLKTIATANDSITHLYYKNTLKTYIESIKDNLIEKDGWFGFINPTGLDIINCRLGNSNNKTETVINKVINNKKACEFIDLYPDRTLFSFIPNKNKTLNREEYNWNYCITYPYKNVYENKLISLLDSTGKNPILNGILTDFCDSNGNKMIDEELTNLTSLDWKEESSEVTLCTRIKNNINVGDYIKIHLVIPKDGNPLYFTIRTNVKVQNVGIGGYNTMYYFTVKKSDILSGIKTIYNKNAIRVDGETIHNLDGLHCYVQRVVNGRPCKYYFRKFRRLPNFKNTNIYNDVKLSSSAIKSVVFNDFDSSLNKLGFGMNVYGDRMAQIVYNDDVDTTNIYDNLGRELHELYLTIIKTNKGNKKWYNDKDYSDNTVECSHCFSEVTSGIDMPWPYDGINDDDYNVHKLHNIPSNFSGNPKYPESVTPLEKYITASGSSKDESTYDGTFLGDIVELDELNVEEYVLEDICHRFNTMQREYTKDGEFSGITVNEIVTDDYDGKFEVSNETYIRNYYINLAPEGYYYKAHYRIPIREFSETVNEGQHTIVKFNELNEINSVTEFYGVTDKNYYFQKGDSMIAYDFKNKKYICTITNVEGDDFTHIEFTTNEPLDIYYGTINFFKPNVLKPSTAYDFDDGSGIYRWRNIESFEFLRTDSELYDGVFTNGAHYIHKNINFFLRRQDPYSLYGLNPNNNDELPYEYQLLEQPGKERDITPAQRFTEGDIQIC
jgi:hypothetical protein